MAVLSVIAVWTEENIGFARVTRCPDGSMAAPAA
jgi:hypothetical protein